MRTGASYYPELGSRPKWEADLAVAGETGLSVLRCGEFCWSRLSPRPGAWSTEWIEDFLDTAHRMDFSVIWCTPSATPPPYLFDRWPDLTAVDENNRPVPAGVRRNYCPSHEGYRELCATTAVRLASLIDTHPAVVGWQIDNELAGDGFTCWCPGCRSQFQRWLEARYGTLDALAAAWQSDVWSQRYSDWSQIPIPHRAFPAHAPALKLAWRRFRSDNWLGFYRAQADALRTAGAARPITTNFFNLSWDMPFDRWSFRPHMDAIGISHYIEEEAGSALELALLRGLDEKPLWVLEQKAGQQNAQNLYPEDLKRLETHLRRCAAAGAEYALYWHLRQHRAGCEMEHGAVLRHDGRPTRIATAIRDAIARLDAPPAATSTTRILAFDFGQHWAQETRPQPGAAWSYRETLEQEWFAALRDLWPDVAVGPYDEALARGEIVFAPHFQMADRTELAEAFLRRGGTLVTTADFGRLDLENNVRPIAPLEGLPEGAATPGEMLHLQPGFSVTGRLGDRVLHGRSFWFLPTSAPGAYHLAHEHFSGPAFLEKAIGRGRLIVLLSAFDRASLTHLLRSLLP